jgi:serine/threonine protein kinase
MFLDVSRVDQPPVCPHCTAPDVSVAAVGVTTCPACRQSVLVVPASADGWPVAVLPAKYGAYSAEWFVARGRSTAVLQGTHETSRQRVALKVLLPQADSDHRSAESFRREIRILEQVQHEHVVRLVDSMVRVRFSYYAMEWIDGPNLQEILTAVTSRGELPPYAPAAVWFRDTCTGLAALHATGAIHGDLRPGHVLTGRDKRARLAAPVGTVLGRNAAGLSESAGTDVDPYLAPECRTAPDTADHRADLYALGATFYALLTNQSPGGVVRPASMLNPAVPPAFDNVLHRLLAESPSDRYGSAEEVLAALPGSGLVARAVGGFDPEADVPSDAAPPPIPRFAMVLSGALIGAVAGGTIGHWLGVDMYLGALVGLFPGALVGRYTKNNPK